MHNSKKNKLKKSQPLWTMVMAMAFWGGNWTCAKILEPMMPVKPLVFFRFFFAALGFLLILLVKKISFKIPKKSIVPMVMCSLLMGVYQYAFFKGLHLGLAGAGGVLVTTLNPIITFALVALLKQKWLSKQEWLGLSLGIVSAVFFLQLWNLNMGHMFAKGNSYFLVASFTWAVLTIVSQYVEISSLLYNFYVFGLSAPLFLIGVPFYEITNVIHQSGVFWLNIGFIVVCGTIFSTTFYFFVAQKHGAKKAASYIFLVPVMAMATSFVVLHERPMLPTLIGGALALTGVYVLNRVEAK